MSNEAFEALKIFMIENYGAKLASGGKEIIKRCHICGDSHNKSSRHMYIGLKSDGLIVYNCFKCNASGLVDGSFFRSLGCYDVNLITLCNENNHKSAKYNELSRKRQIVKRTLPILTCRDAPETYKKVNYINNRLGTNFTIEDMSRLKIVLNLYDFVGANSIGTLTRDKRICDELDTLFLGFLSLDNSYLNMRRLVPEGRVHPNIDTRYVNYNIYGFHDNSARYYFMPTQINTLRPLVINIAEGPFDILGVYYNTNSDKSNSIFASIGGKSYFGLIKYLIMTYGFINFTLHIYADNDVDQYEFYKIKQLLSPMGITVFLHFNCYPGEKDFGVPASRINDSITRL